MNAIADTGRDSLQHRTHPRVASHHNSRTRGTVSHFEVAIALAIAALLVVSMIATSGGPKIPQAEKHRVRVEAGQTLWSLARANPVPGMTTQQTAEFIAQTNGLTGGSIAARTTVVVPVPHGSDLVASR